MLSTRDFRQFLAAKIAGRQVTLASLAKTMDVSSAFLSQVLSNRRSLSAERAAQLAEILELEADDRSHFLLLVRLSRAKTEAAKAEVEAELAARTNKSEEPVTLEVDTFSVVARWHHAAILELLDLKNLDPTPIAIARRLGIDQPSAEMALSRLERLGLVERVDGRFAKTKGNIQAGYVASAAVRQFHGQMLDKAKTALDRGPYEERDFRGTTFAFAMEDLPLISDMIDRLYKELRARKRSRDSSCVMHLATQVFRVDRPPATPPFDTQDGVNHEINA